MLQGTVAWPETAAEQYRRAGHWDGRCVVDVLSRAARAQPDKTALVFDGVRHTYAQLDARANHLAALLQQRGVAQIDEVRVDLNPEQRDRMIEATGLASHLDTERGFDH